MGQRATRKAGILQIRRQEPSLQKTLDSIIERLEVLDGIRGDTLDQAVTFRDLDASGFTVSGERIGGVPQVIVTPPSEGDGPVIGPAAPPTALSVNETFLAVLLTWTNPAFNLQHIEVWRATTDNLSLATMIGTTVSPQFVDYIGDEQTYYYWVRAVGTDGTYSAYNATAGTEGTTGIDPSSISMDPRFFTLVDGTGTALPFLVDADDNIGIDGNLIVSESIRATSIIAGSIGTREIFVEELSGISADLGIVTAGVLTTEETRTGYRVEIENVAGTVYPLWYGSGSKNAGNGRFYIDQNGNVVVKGLLDAGMIKQSFFTPAPSNNSFRIACDYPANYSGGIYTGKAAHLLPLQSINTQPAHLLGSDIGGQGSLYISDAMVFYGPTYSGVNEYNRFGTTSEVFMIMLSAMTSMSGILGAFDNPSDAIGTHTVRISIEYKYDDDIDWVTLFTTEMKGGRTATSAWSQLLVTRSSPAWTTLSMRAELVLMQQGGNWETTWVTLDTLSFTAFCPNFGVGDATLTTVAAETTIGDLPDYPVLA